MIKAVGNKLLMVLYFLLGTIVLELVTFNVLNLNFMPEYFMLDFSIMLFFALLIYCIPNFTIQYIIYTAMFIAQAVFLYVNYSLHTIYGDLFSFDMLKLLKEANKAMTANFVYFKIIFQLVLIVLALASIGFLFLTICRKSKIKIRQHYSIFSIIILLGVQFFAGGYYVHMRNYINEMGDVNEDNYINSDAFLMNTNFLKTTSYNKFGTYGYFLNLMFNSIGKTTDAQKTATIKYFNSGFNNMYNSSDVFGVDKGNNVIVIMMESIEWFGFGDGNYDLSLNNLNAQTYEQTLIPNMYEIIFGQDHEKGSADNNPANVDALISNNFFAKSKTNISEGYGILGNYPVAESLSSFAGKTYDSSLNAFGYSLPSMLNAQTTTLADGSQQGYYTSYVHSNVIDFYQRNETHQNIGFSHVYGKDNILDEFNNPIYTGDDLKWDNWAPEGDFARYAINYLIPTTNGQPFFTFYLNVSSHGSYTAEKNTRDGDAIRYLNYVKYGKENCQLVKADYKTEKDKFFLDDDGKIITTVGELYARYANETEPVPNYKWEKIEPEQEEETETEPEIDQTKIYSTWFYNILKNYGTKNEITGLFEENKTTDLLAYYECGVVGLDEAIGVIINKLKSENILDKTTLVFYSDHYGYFDGVANIVKGFNVTDTSSIELNTIPMIISSPGLKKQMADGSAKHDYTLNQKFCSAYDVVPTVLDLLGVSFNPNFYMGHSLFCPADYVYVIDEQTHLARDVQPGEEDLATEMVVYYSNTGGLFSKDAFTFNLKDFYTRTGAPLHDEYLIKYFKSEATNILYKLNYLHILNRNHLYNKLTIE